MVCFNVNIATTETRVKVYIGSALTLAFTGPEVFGFVAALQGCDVVSTVEINIIKT